MYLKQNIKPKHFNKGCTSHPNTQATWLSDYNFALLFLFVCKGSSMWLYFFYIVRVNTCRHCKIITKYFFGHEPGWIVSRLYSCKSGYSRKSHDNLLQPRSDDLRMLWIMEMSSALLVGCYWVISMNIKWVTPYLYFHYECYQQGELISSAVQQRKTTERETTRTLSLHLWSYWP